MSSRGYQGQFRSFSRPGMKTADWLFLALTIIFLAAILAASFM
jgi:energy-coupling factor transporter transmembrane protein EcfT